MKKLEPPKILVDLYRDLRDRRLLLPLAFLAVGLILVPVALSKSSHPAPPSAASLGGGSEVGAAVPAVMTEEVGVRAYKKRLAMLKEKDPFKRHLKLPALPGGNPGQLAAPPPTDVATTPPSSSTSASATSGEAVAPVSGSTSGLTSSGNPTTTSSSSTTQTVTVPSGVPQQPRIYRTVVDLKIGTADKLKRRNSVKPLTELPHASNPVVALVGATLDRKRASFLVSRDIASVHGGSGCSPHRHECEILTMKPGGKAKLTDSASGKTYVLRVLAIRLVRVKLGQKSGGGSGTSHSGSGGVGPSGKAAFSSGSGS
jgi:hypothetical protein